MLDPSLARALDQIRVDIIEGRPERALELAQAVVGAFDDEPAAHYALASAMIATGADPLVTLTTAQNTQSMAMLLEGGVDLRRVQTDAGYASLVGRRFYNANMLGAASIACACTGSDPTIAHGAGNGLHVWAQALFHQGAGRMEQALRAFVVAFKAAPSPTLYSFILYTLFFVENGRERHAAEARAWAQKVAEPLMPANPVFGVERHADRRLRIGYLAPTFSGQLGQFVSWVIAGHDPERFEVFAYVDDADKEDFGETVTVRTVRPLTYEMNAQLIRDDRIDVLIDVWGHASNNRMPVFARKPAPIQMSWCNYHQTTGMRAMDYVVLSDGLNAPGREALFSEQIVSVGPIVSAFRPRPGTGPSPAPQLAKGYVTFASYNHPAKVSEGCIAAWAAILRTVPTARLLFKYTYFVDPVVQETLRAKFLGYGADPAALMFEGFSKGAEYHASFAEVDLMLDTSPATGGTTTLEAFCHGVPVLTLDERTDYFARIGVEAVMALGLPELVAESWDDYVAKAVALANDPEGLSALRARVRPAFDASPYRDEEGFIGRMEGLYRAVFETWLAEEDARAVA